MEEFVQLSDTFHNKWDTFCLESNDA